MKELLKKTPVIKELYRHLQKIKYKKAFEGECYGCFWGVYNSFDEAIKAAPTTKCLGYDNLAIAQEYLKKLEDKDKYFKNKYNIINTYDYPLVLWLKAAINEGSDKVFDFGGNLGLHYYDYFKYLGNPSHLKWTVCEVKKSLK